MPLEWPLQNSMQKKNRVENLNDPLFIESEWKLLSATLSNESDVIGLESFIR